jgi:hypothetical protein
MAEALAGGGHADEVMEIELLARMRQHLDREIEQRGH